MIPKDEDINSMVVEGLAAEIASETLLLEATIDVIRDDLTDCSEKIYNLNRMARALQEKLKEQEESK